MEKVIVILFTVFSANSSMADISALPPYEQARKLVQNTPSSMNQLIINSAQQFKLVFLIAYFLKGVNVPMK